MKKGVAYEKWKLLITSDKSDGDRSEDFCQLLFWSFVCILYIVCKLSSLVIKAYFNCTLLDWWYLKQQCQNTQWFYVSIIGHGRCIMYADIKHLYVSDSCSCYERPRHGVFPLRTVLSDTDISVGKSLGQNKALFRASWLFLKVWMFASSEVLKPQVFGVVLSGSGLPARERSNGKCRFPQRGWKEYSFSHAQGIHRELDLPGISWKNGMDKPKDCKNHKEVHFFP